MLPLCGKRGFADVIKDLEMKRFSCILGVSLKCRHKGLYKNRAEGDLTQETEEAADGNTVRDRG